MTRYLREILKAGVGTPAWPWRDVPSRDYYIYQSPPELEALCMWLQEQDVRSYLEIGVAKGGTWTLLTELLGFELSCGITLADHPLLHQPEQGHLLIADSHSDEALGFAMAHGPFDFIFHDGDHEHETVLFDYRRYWPLCRYMGFHDIAGLYGCHPYRRRRRFVPQKGYPHPQR